MTKIKICGIQSLELALAAVNAGADYLGFNFVPHSKRYIEPRIAKAIVNEMKHYPVICVAVVMDAASKPIEALCRETGIRTVQNHAQRPEDLSEVFDQFFVITVNHDGMIQGDIKKQYSKCRTSRDVIILDYDKPGSGYSYPVEDIKRQSKDIPFFLAGGINSENVKARLSETNAIGVDAASAVNTIDKCRTFISTVREYDHAN